MGIQQNKLDIHSSQPLLGYLVKRMTATRKQVNRKLWYLQEEQENKAVEEKE